MEEKIILEFEINGIKYLYTAEINNKNYLDEISIEDKKYIHIKCKISSNKSESNIIHGITICISDKCLNTVSCLNEFVNEIVQSMKISYDKNKFVKNLIKFINEKYLSKLLDFDGLEYIFNQSLHKNKLSYVFDYSEFIPCKRNIDFDNTKVEIYPYAFNNKLYLHIKVSNNGLGGNIVFEYKLTNRSNGELDYYKDACGILSKIFNEGYVMPTIYSVETIVDMIKYCFNEKLFKNIEQIESFESDSKEE